MSFPEAVATVYAKKFADFSGRGQRSEFWFGYLAFALATMVANLLSSELDSQVPALLLFAAAVVPFLASGARRLHDVNRSAWWLLLFLTIIGILLLITFFAMDGDAGGNQYGPSPKGIDSEGRTSTR